MEASHHLFCFCRSLQIELAALLWVLLAAAALDCGPYVHLNLFITTKLEPVASNIVAQRADLSSATNFSQLVSLDYQPANSTHDFHFQTRRLPIILSTGRVASCARDSTVSYSSWLNSFTCEDRQPRLLEADDHP